MIRPFLKRNPRKSKDFLVPENQRFSWPWERMNNRGQILSESTFLFWRIFLVGLIIFFIAITIGATFVSKQDVRGAEAILLSEKITDCIVSKGTIKIDFNLDNCFINNDEYYVNASLNSLESGLRNEKLAGDHNLETDCALLEKGTEMKEPPGCLRQRFYVLIDNNSQIEKGALNLLIGVKKYSENIK